MTRRWVLVLPLVLTTAVIAQEQRAPQGPIAVDVKGPLILAFFPPFTEKEEADDDGGIREGLAHVAFALDDIEKCYQNPKATYRLDVTRSITLRDGRRMRRIPLSREWTRSVGILLTAPGRAPRIVFAGAGPSSLQWIGREAAAEYFGASGCNNKEP